MIFDKFFKKKKKTEKKLQPKTPSFISDFNIPNIPPERKGEDYLHAMEQVSWIYSAIRVISQTIAAANWRLYEVKNKERNEIEDHEALKFFNNPNPYTTRTELFLLTSQHLELIGEACWLLIKDFRNKIIGISILNPTKMTLRMDAGIPEYWEYGSKKIRLELEDVVFFKYPNPANPYRGLSPLKAAAIAGDTDLYSAEWNRNFFYNAAAPSGVIKSEHRLSDEQFQRLKLQIDQMYKGLKNAHKVVLLEEGIDFKPIQISHKDMEFLELRRFTRTEIAAVFGVPLSKLGISEEVNKATAYVNDYTFAKNTITPKLTLIKEALNKYYLPHFGDNLTFGFDSVIPKDEEFLVYKHTQYTRGNIMTINEVRNELGLKPVKWGDEPTTPVIFSAEKKNLNFDRDKYWEKFVQKQERSENFFKGWIINRFSKQEKKIIELLKNKKSFKDMNEILAERYADEILSFLYDDEQWIWMDFYEKKMEDVVVSASENYMEQFNLFISLSDHMDIVEELLEKRSQKFAQKVNETTYKQLKQTLVEGFLKGEGEKKLAKRVEDVMSLAKRQRAATIARTEIYGAVNNSHHLTLLENGIEKKEWLTARDERVRTEHENADGQIVNVNEPFIVGGEHLMYPLDPAGSPGNIINCRCTVIPVL
ncbi:phage portal protein [Marinitoga sp. 1137]|uniref:phage portal protein n=1 Tax=Marinitoga sp. 1137 TaxID=1545835 RepID=UPI000951164A|nr:phage portal protein [Marinitoga sp. 1137]